MSAIKIVNVLTSKNTRIVVTCQDCPISLEKFGTNQKSACIHFRNECNRLQRRLGKVKLKRIQSCEWYQKDSLKKKIDSGVNIITCNYQ